MRPTSVAWFERLLLSALAVDLINNLMSWYRPAADLSARGLASNSLVALGFSILPPALGLVLWYFVTRRASNVARWVTTIFVIFGTIGFVVTACSVNGAISRSMFVVAAMAELLKLAAVFCLFAASAAAWFDRQHRPLQ